MRVDRPSAVDRSHHLVNVNLALVQVERNLEQSATIVPPSVEQAVPRTRPSRKSILWPSPLRGCFHNSPLPLAIHIVSQVMQAELYRPHAHSTRRLVDKAQDCKSLDPISRLLAILPS